MSERIIKAFVPSLDGNKEIVIENGWIKEIREAKEASFIAVPGFIDTHIHGFGGHGTEEGSEEAILEMSKELIVYGVTSFFPTLYTDSTENMEKALIAINSAKGKEEGAEIAGIHIEGPFISPSKIGAQNPEGRKDPDLALFRHFLSLAPNLVKAMTIAPELEGVEEIRKEAEKEGVVLLIGHTDASFEEARGSGIKHATHLFNAMKGLSHRAPGVVGAILADEDATTEIIADGLHVHPEVFKIAVKAKTVDNVIAVTDSLRPTGQKEGPFSANFVPVVLKDDLWVTKGREDLIQGSSLDMHHAFTNLVSWGYSLKEAVKMTSENASKRYLLQDIGTIEVGKKADIVIMNEKLEIVEVLKCGTTN